MLTREDAERPEDRRQASRARRGAFVLWLFEIAIRPVLGSYRIASKMTSPTYTMAIPTTQYTPLRSAYNEHGEHQNEFAGAHVVFLRGK